MKSLQDISIQYIKGVGPVKKKLFQNLGIENVEDLLYFFPRRYEERTHLTPLSDLKVGEYQTVTGKVAVRGSRRSWFTKKHVYETVIDDGKGKLFCVWFNQPYLDQYLKVGKQVVLYGKVEIYKDRLQMVAPEYEMIDDDQSQDQNLNIGRIVPIYPLTKGVTQRYLRKVIRSCLNRYRDYSVDILPVRLRNKYRLSNIKNSLENMHFPKDYSQQESAHRRISFEEFFLFQISVILRRMSIVTKEGIQHKVEPDLIKQFSQSFPFPLTQSQIKVIQEIATDMQKPSPMLRLLQGDVGSGKTLVALFGCIVAYQNGRQSALMAPTEILARQHYISIQEMIAAGPFSSMRIALLMGSLLPREKEKIFAELTSGSADLVIGTHALISETVNFANLSYVVIDEQHKFGVKQRALLSTKGPNPDVLVMTATPIPRTLSMTLYGDMDISSIQELPPGRGKVETRFYPNDQAEPVYQIVRDKVKQGGKAYIIYPMVEESEKLDLKAAEGMYRHFTKQEFKDFSLGLVHGQMNRKEAEIIMEKFKNGEIKILVATTVLELGIDIPDANVMVVEHAERFGLAQLHQLRGRIGRGDEDAVCLLLGDPATEEAKARLEAIVSLNDGFRIAEQDLLIRGPGHYFGRYQHGFSELKFANPMTQLDILKLAREEAKELTQKDPHLHEPQNCMIKEVIQKRYPHYLSMVQAG